jgi:hypothetical protein
MLPTARGRRWRRHPLAGLGLSLLISWLPGLESRAANPASVEGLRIAPLSGWVELGFLDSREDRFRSGTGVKPDFDKTEVSSTLHLDFLGSVYHPRFLRFDGMGELGLLQRLEGGDDATLVGGNMNIDLLAEHPYGLSLFAARKEEPIDQTFARSFEQESTSYGARLRLHRGPLPLSATYNHIERNRADADFGDETFDQVNAHGEYRLGEDSRGTLDYFLSFDDLDFAEEDRDRVRRQQFTAGNTLYFGPGRRNRFGGMVRLEEQDGDTERHGALGSGNLSWIHSESLSSTYGGRISWDSINGQRTFRSDGSASLDHQLYESLHSTLEGYARFTDADFGTTNQLGASLTEKYTKRLSDWGWLRIGITPFVEWIDFELDEDTALVVDEAVTLPDAIPVELGRPSIDVPSLVVTNQIGSIVYVEGFDYRLNVFGPITEIQRIPTGNIANGETVAVDYRFELPGNDDVLQKGFRSAAELSFPGGVSLFGRILETRWDTSSERAEQRLEERRRHALGVRWNVRWISARVEYEREQSTFTEWDGFSESISLTTPRRTWWQASLSASHAYRDFQDPDETFRRAAVIATLRARIAVRGLLELSSEWEQERWDSDVRRSDVDGLGVRGSFTWRFRRMLVTLEGRHSRVERYDQDENVDRIELRIRREF